MWLCVEYTYRYGKIHSTEKLLGDLLGYTPKGLKDNGFTEPPQCMGDYCKVKGMQLKDTRTTISMRNSISQSGQNKRTRMVHRRYGNI